MQMCCGNQGLVSQQQQDCICDRPDGADRGGDGSTNSHLECIIVNKKAAKWPTGRGNLLTVVASHKDGAVVANLLGGPDGPPNQHFTVIFLQQLGCTEAAR